MNKDFILKFQSNLLTWYGKNKRDLPWRRTKDPYKIWISEIILQQTRIDQGTPYYGRFIRKFSTVEALAKAPLSEVLKSWEGLGYYSRARNLHKAAQLIAEKYGGKIPSTHEAITELPGFGPYTAAAVLSIAYGKDHALVDGNVIRVLTRLFAIKKNPKETATRKKLWKLAQELLPAGKAGVYNQALMELGALVCTPRNPHCAACPIHTLCTAHAKGMEEKFPVQPPQKIKPHYEIAVGIVEKKGKVLLMQRPEKGLLGGMWEFPGGKREKESLIQCCEREIEEKTGVRVRVISQPLCVLKHAYTHFSITLYAYTCRILEDKHLKKQSLWIPLGKLKRYAIHTSNLNVLKAWKKNQLHQKLTEYIQT